MPYLPGCEMTLSQERRTAHCPPGGMIVQHTARALGLPLLSLEIELGPSQVEAVFEATDALTAADSMVLFRNGVRQALRRAGYHASFVCRPPFANVMASGWHLHQSLVRLEGREAGRNVFQRDAASPAADRGDAQPGPQIGVRVGRALRQRDALVGGAGEPDCLARQPF